VVTTIPPSSLNLVLGSLVILVDCSRPGSKAFEPDQAPDQVAGRDRNDPGEEINLDVTQP
jgi:hypothetical protein